MWLCSISSAPNVSFECKCYFKNIDDPFDSLLIKTNSKYKYIYNETVFNIYMALMKMANLELEVCM